MTLLWVVINGGFSSQSFQRPLVYAGGDELWVYAVVKAVADGEIGLFETKDVSRLGAPFVANWNDFPLTEDLLLYVTGQVAKLVGVPTAINLAYIAAFILAACAFYTVGRYLRWSVVWCFAGAILYGCSYYMTHRSVAHFNLLFYWPIPFWLLTCWWTAARPGLPFRSRKFWFSAAVVLFTAWNNPYYTNIFLQLLVLAVVARWVRGYPKSTMMPPVALAVFCVGLVVTANLDTLIYQSRHGVNGDAALRSLSHLELYALRPVDLFLPFSHRIAALEAFTQSYAARSLLRGEVAFTYLGLLACIALLHLWGGTIRNLLSRTRARIDGLSLQSLWILFYCVCGSLSLVPGLLGFVMFRAMNRGSVVIMTLALFHAVRWASRNTGRWPPVAVGIVAPFVVLVGLWDQTQSPTATLRQSAATQIGSDRAFVQRLEQQLHARAMIFQLPEMRSQEGAPLHQMRPYDHFRPYVVSKSLRFSHGDDFGRATGEWRAMLASLPIPQMAEQLERHGFAGVLINRNAYPDQAAAGLQAFAALGKPADTVNPHPAFAFVRLAPSATPAQPILPAFCARGWYPPERNASDIWRWTEGDASIELYRPPHGVKTTTITYDLQSPDPRTIEIKKFGKLNKQVELTRAVDRRRIVMNIDWPEDRDVISLDFSTNTPTRFAPNEHRAIAYRVLNLTQTPAPFQTGPPTQTAGPSEQ